MISRTEGYFKGYNDFELFFQVWKPESSTATLVVTHGLGEHSECYNRLAEGVVSLPVSVISWDLRGHGRSEGKRGVVRKFSDYCEDLVLFLNFLKKQNYKGPTFLLGHSMGGLINALTVIEKGHMNLSGLLFSSPLMKVNVSVPTLKKKGAQYLAKWVPDLTLYNEIPNKILSQDIEVLKEFDRDSLRHDRISPQLYLDILECTDFALKNASKIEIPTLIQQSGLDKVVNGPAAYEFYKNISSHDKQWIEYKKSYHEIFNDIERNKVFSDIRDWLTQHMKERSYEVGTH